MSGHLGFTNGIDGGAGPGTGGIGSGGSGLEQEFSQLLQQLEELEQELSQALGQTQPGGTERFPDAGPGGGPGSGDGSGDGSGAVSAVGNAGSTASPTASNASGGSDAGPVSSGDAASAIADNLRQHFGLNDAQIAGVLGNLQQESGLQGDINQGGAIGAPSANDADDNRNGWGLAQWGGSRKQGEIGYARQHAEDPGSLQANLGYMDQELSGSYGQTIADLKNASTPDQAAQVWDTDYEQATDPQMGSRDAFAGQFAAQGL